MHLPFRTLVLAGICALGLSTVGRADTIVTLYLTDFNFVSGATATGMATLDSTTGFFTNINVTYRSSSEAVLLDGLPYQGATDLFDAEYYDGKGHDLDLTFPIASLVGYTGGDLCSSKRLCDGFERSVFFLDLPSFDEDFLATGSLSEEPPVANTPEPRSVILLGTGLLIAIEAARRRFSQVNRSV
jgi:hypothetical protein